MVLDKISTNVAKALSRLNFGRDQISPKEEFMAQQDNISSFLVFCLVYL